ncbi:sensor histidine kinase [Isoptericola aurantiacus]|uniref:sensor histidine kinase n=1 Tax=Isoptericola aurantiacus TaxID=3377839 RepID=UPI00383A9339
MPDHPTAGGVADAGVDARPGRAPGPPPWVADVVLAGAQTSVLILAVAVGPDGAAPTPGDDPWAVLFAVVVGALVLLRRRAPVGMLGLTVLVVVPADALALVPISAALPAVAALASAAEQDRTRWAAGAGAVLVVVPGVVRLVDGDPSSVPTVATLVTDAALVTAAVALGVAARLTRTARRHADEVRALGSAQETQAAELHRQAERMRLAGDLHDVVGHHLSMVMLHTEVAAEALGRDDDGARTALRHVREATSATLHELRATTRLLRRPPRPGDAAPDGGTPRETLPAATGPAGLARLVEPARTAGLVVSTRVDVPARSIDATVDAAAYRIVQEALANVLRHSGARHVLVRLAVVEGRLRVTVSDDGAGSSGPAAAHRWIRPSDPRSSIAPAARAQAAAGAGIAGMVERAALLGGTLIAADGPDGGFRVAADLPAHLED